MTIASVYFLDLFLFSKTKKRQSDLALLFTGEFRIEIYPHFSYKQWTNGIENTPGDIGEKQQVTDAVHWPVVIVIAWSLLVCLDSF